MSEQTFMNRITGLLLIEAINSNPNGDPDRESDPRHRSNGLGEISSVSFKAKLRSLIGDKDGPVWSEFSKKYGLAEDNYEILESKGRNISELRKLSTNELLSRFWDARVFGVSLLEKDEESQQHIHTGAVQFGTGISLDPVRIIRNTTTIKRGVQKDKDRGMAPLAYRVVEYGLYAMPFFLNPTVAGRTQCTEKDVQLLLDVIPYAYSHTASYVRPYVNIRHAWLAEHSGPLGSCPDWKILEAMTPKRNNHNDEKLPAGSIEDYSTPTKLPEGILSKLASFKDIINT